MKLKNLSLIGIVLGIALIVLGSFESRSAAQVSPSATFYGANRLTNGTAFIEPALSSQLPALLVNGAFNTNQSLIPITALSGANASVTLTLPADASSFHYITSIQATRTCTTAIVGSAVLAYTSTNLPNSMAWSAGNACAVGSTTQDIWNDFADPVKSSVANTNTTIVAPAAGAAGIIRLTAYYFTAP